MKQILVLIFFLIHYYASIAQTSSVPKDNPSKLVSWVTQQLETATIDSLAVFQMAHQSLEAAKIENKKKLVAAAYRNLATWHLGSKKIDSSVYYYQKAKSIYAAIKEFQLQAETCLEFENAYKQRSNYSLAMTQDFEAIALYEKIKDNDGLAKCYARLCDLMYYQEKYTDGTMYCQKAIDIQKKLNVPDELAISYRYKADNLLILKKYEEALFEINEAIKILKAAGKSDSDMMAAYNTKGNIYKHMKRYDEALLMYKLNYELTKKERLDRYLVPTLGNIGHVYRLQGKYEMALPYMLEAIDIIKNSGNTQNLWENYLHVSDSYEALQKFDKALKYRGLYFNEELEKKNNTIRQLESELQIKYETAKKDETIEVMDAKISQQKKNQLLYGSIAALFLIILVGMYYTLSNIRKKREALKVLNTELEFKRKDVEISNTALLKSLEDLKSTQTQLIQSEKMASLGELTAGIAHEIQNPLNFVNNFSEVSSELLDEMYIELEKGVIDEAKAIANDVKQNLEKINHHGKRADAIVKGMLQHSRSSSGKKEKTDLNALCDEYLRLSYHGLRAKDKSFNATFKTDFDNSIGEINLIPQDFGRVILNLLTNAFYAVTEKKHLNIEGYEPTVSIATKKENDTITITVTDNGNGMPKEIMDKVFQPFFTTKPTGKGTGLGLSMSYDIITKGHNGELKVESEQGEGSTFTIILNHNN